MNQVYAKLQNCYECVRKKTDFVPKVAIVLGSGLGDYAEQIRVVTEIPYAEIEGFPVSTVPGHAGKFIFGYLDEIPVVCMKGRVHYYEGYDVTDVVLPTRLMKLLGAEILFLTNAAGGVNTSFHAGDLMLIRDHISVFAPNPLIGANMDELGLRFPDMSHVYDKDLQQIIRETAKENGIYLQEGIYTQLTGPSFESPAEIRMLRTLGCDAVGMSTVVEAIAANHMGMRICGISCISNLAAGMTDQPLNHEEVQEAADMAASQIQEAGNGICEEICIDTEKKEMRMIQETEEKALVSQALEARKLAYAPYSGYTVGAALLTADGHRYLGGNIENASYGATNCAERTAFFKAVSEGEREFTAIAIAGGISGEAPVEYAYPCGICRQVMQEFCRDDFVIYVVNSEQDYQRYTLKELLPFGFGGDAIR